jgi:hypothetical protein
MAFVVMWLTAESLSYLPCKGKDLGGWDPTQTNRLGIGKIMYFGIPKKTERPRRSALPILFVKRFVVPFPLRTLPLP